MVSRSEETRFQRVGSHMCHGDVNALQSKPTRNTLVVEQVGCILLEGTSRYLRNMTLEPTIGSGLFG